MKLAACGLPRSMFAALAGASLAAGCAVPPPREAPPIPTRPLSVKVDCNFRDHTGYRGAIRLAIAQAQVSEFEARIDVPRRGSCRFALRDFRQTESLPNVVLSAQGSRCVVRMWEQADRVTVAFTECQDRCTSKEIFQYVWPVFADARTGGCG